MTQLWVGYFYSPTPREDCVSELDVSVWDASSPDPLLITAVRQGDATAFGVLFSRHADAARTVARQYISDPSDVEDVVADGFEKVLQVLRSGGGPDVAFRAYLFTVVRRLAYVQVDQGRRTQPTDEDYIFESAIGPLASVEEPTLRGFEDRTVALAFESLPERWRSVLWYTDIEGQTPAAVAPIFGLTANGVAALAYRAREGLRQAYLQQHLQGDVDDECRRANTLLGSYVRGGLNKRETTLVEGHLEDCGRCRALVLELGDVAQSMRGIVAPLVLGIAGMGALAGGLPLWGAGAATGVGTLFSGAGVTAGGGSGGSAGGPAASPAGAASGAAVAGGSRMAKTLVGAAAVVVLATVLAAGAMTNWFSGAGDDQPVAGSDHSASDAAPLTPPQSADPDADSPEPPVDSDTDPDADPDADLSGSDPFGSDSFSSDTGSDDAFGEPGIDGLPGAERFPPFSGTGPWGPGNQGDAPVPGPNGSGSNPPAGTPPGVPDPSQQSEPNPPASSPTPPPGEPTTPTQPTTPAQPPTQPTTPTDPPPPTQPPVPPVVSASAQEVSVGLDGLIALTEAPLRATVTNESENPADGAVVEMTLPAGEAKFIGTSAGNPGQGPLRILQAPGGVVQTTSGGVTWSCDIAASGDTATCSAEELPAGAVSDVSLDVMYTGYGVRKVDVAVTVRIGDDEFSQQVETDVQSAPAKLTVDVHPESELVVGQAGWLTAAVNNRGELGASEAKVEFTLPEHVQWVLGDAGAVEARSSVMGRDGWQCAVPNRSEPALVSCEPSGDMTPNPGNTADLTEHLSLAVKMPARSTGSDADALPADVQAQAHWDGQSSVRSIKRISALQVDVGVTYAADKLELTAGGTAVDATVELHNSSSRTARNVAVALTLPEGITPVGGCEPANADAGCVVGDLIAELPSGERQQIAVQLTAPAQQAMGISAVDAVTTATVWDASPVGAPLTVGTSSADLWVGTTDFGPSQRFTGNVAVAEIGAPLLFCDENDPACARAAQGLGSNTNLNNDAHRSYPLTEDPCPNCVAPGGVTSSSIARLRDAPAGAEVKYAELFWSANDWGANPPGQDRAYLKAPRGQYQEVVASGPVQTAGGFYAASADVTDLVRASDVAGDWSVANIGIDPNRIGKKAVYAGWSLVVIYEDASAPTGEVILYDGALSLRGEVSKELALTGAAGTQARIGVVAWEGDRGILGDFMQMNGTALKPQRFTTSPGDAPTWTPGDANNAFDSTATGFRLPNSLGVDAKAFETADLQDGRNTLKFGTAGDAYLLTAVTVHTTQQ